MGDWECSSRKNRKEQVISVLCVCVCIYIYIYIYIYSDVLPHSYKAHLAGAVEYADCIRTPNTTTSVLDMTLNHPCDGKFPILELWRMWSISSLSLLPGPL